MHKTIQIVAGFVILVAVILNAATVFSRYVFNYSFVWSDEVLIYANIWVVSLGAITAALVGQHLSIDAISHRLSNRARAMQANLIEAVTLVVAAAAAVASVNALKVILRTGQSSVAAGMPMWVPHGAMLVAFCAFALVAAWRLAQALRKGSPE